MHRHLMAWAAHFDAEVSKIGMRLQHMANLIIGPDKQDMMLVLHWLHAL